MTGGRVLLSLVICVLSVACGDGADVDGRCESPLCGPDAAGNTPDTGIGQPDADDCAADAAGNTPDATGNTPDATDNTADAAGNTADAAGNTPDAAGNTPDAAGNTPDAAGNTPDAAGNLADAMADATAAPDAPVDDCDPDPPNFPGADEIAGDGQDNDCDGFVDELEVCASGTPYATIAAAIAAASSGDTIEICEGVYREHLVISGKSLRLVASGAAIATILDAEQTGTALIVTSTPAPGVVLEGMTIRDGYSPARGGGIACSNSTLRLERVLVHGGQALEGGGMYALSCQVNVVDSELANNQATDTGGAVSVRGGSGAIRRSTVHGNIAGRNGGGVSIIDGTFELCTSNVTANRAGLQGGGMRLSADTKIEDNLIEGNSAGWTGGGMYVDQKAPFIRRNIITDNTSENDGGGIYVHQSDCVIEDNTIERNVSHDDGGGLRLFECAAIVQRNRFADNHADDSGGGIRVSHVPSTFIDNTVVGNTATGTGGGMDMDNDSSVVSGGTISRNTASSGGGIHAWMFPWFGGAIENVVFEGNRAWKGGAIHIRHNFQSITLRGLTLVDNEASYGGGIYVRTSHFTLSHSVFAGNTASHYGGAIAVGDDGSSYHESECPPCPPLVATGSLDFVVAFDNLATDGGSALWMKSPDLRVHSSVLLHNTTPSVVVLGPDVAPPGGDGPAPGDPEPPPPPSPPVWRFNDTYPAGAAFVGMVDPTAANGNISADPLFIDAIAGDFSLGSASQCIDAGDPSFIDADGSRADMGVFGGLGGTP